MSEGTKWHESRICGCCGKTFSVFYPDLWRYKRGDKVLSYFCSWSCLRKFDKEQEGKDDLNMSGRMKKDGTQAKRPGPKPKKIEIPEEAPVLKVDGALKIETPEAARVDVVEVKPSAEDEQQFDERCTTTAIRVEGLGEFYFDKKYNSIDWRNESGDEVSMGPAWWKQLIEDLPRIMKKLEVDL